MGKKRRNRRTIRRRSPEKRKRKEEMVMMRVVPRNSSDHHLACSVPENSSKVAKRCFKRKILLRQFSGEDLLLDYDYNGLQFAGSIENTSEWKSTIALICVLGENLLLIELCLSEAKGYCWPARNKL